ncbi:MAG: peptidase S41 [Chitinophagaceae bacterium]|nr:MAG: peptidase S41 [Chitinophagaceae bacterium]
MKRIPLITYLLLLVLLASSCAVQRNLVPEKKYGRSQLEKDYTLFRNVLEESHPSLYWFVSKPEMDHYFDDGWNQLRDSLTEREFRTLLSYVVSKMRDGHTAVRYSKKYSSYLDTAQLKIFPLSVKAWADTMVVTGNLNRSDSMLRRGTIISAINGVSVPVLIDSVFSYLSSDGNAITGKYQAISNRGNFGAFYKNIFGLPDSLDISYYDRWNQLQIIRIPAYDPTADTTDRKPPADTKKPSREENRYIAMHSARNVQVDTTLSSAFMTVNTFSRGHRLKSFFRKSFRTINRLDIKYLVIDVRTNGGGDASNSTLLTRFITDKPFKLADSLYAITRRSKYRKHIEMQPLYWLMMQFITHRGKDGNYHFGYLERHVFKPRKRNHFNGEVYILTGGNSFSATALFAKKLQGQSNVKIIGEETGGGAYGNSAWMLPDVTLPVTGVRFSLPKFRLVMDKDAVAAGRGVMPDIEVLPTVESIRRGIDPKVQVIKEIILSKNGIIP